MTRGGRIRLMLVAFGLLVAGLGGIARSQSFGGPKKWRVSGTIGVAGVRLRLEDAGSEAHISPVTDENGVYSVEVAHGWAGAITPVKEGYVFEPPLRTYAAVKNNYDGQDYTAKKRMVTISNTLKAGDEPIEGVEITAQPGGYSDTTDSQGRYRIKVPYGWSGRLVLFADDVEDIGPFVNVTSDIIDKKVEAPPLRGRMVTISNSIKAGNEPVQGVTVTARPGGYSAVTDSLGRYSLKVPYGWSGSLSFHKPDLDIVGEVEYRNVTADVTDRKYISPEDEWPPFPSEAPQGSLFIPAGKIFVIPTTQMTADAIVATTDDLQTTLAALRWGLWELRNQGGLLDAGRYAEALYLQGAAVIFTVEMGLAPSPRTWPMVFERFQDELLRSLRHAAGLRSIDPNELVILTLVAPNGFVGQPVLSMTVLTMQARKADVDAFAQGALDFDQFRRKVKSIAY